MIYSGHCYHNYSMKKKQSCFRAFFSSKHNLRLKRTCVTCVNGCGDDDSNDQYMCISNRYESELKKKKCLILYASIL